MTINLSNGTSAVMGIIENNPVAVAVGAAGAGVALGVGAAAVVGAVKSRKNKRSKARNSRKRNNRIKHTKRGWSQDRKRFNKRQKWEVAYRRKKSKSKKGIHYTKKGQPYKIMSNGRARFIKKKGGKR